jgi:hypothetical protein
MSKVKQVLVKCVKVRPTATAQQQAVVEALTALYGIGGKQYTTASHPQVKQHGFTADRVLTFLVMGSAPNSVCGMGVGSGAQDVVKKDKGARTVADMRKVLQHAPRGWSADKQDALDLLLHLRGVAKSEPLRAALAAERKARG